MLESQRQLKLAKDSDEINAQVPRHAMEGFIQRQTKLAVGGILASSGTWRRGRLATKTLGEHRLPAAHCPPPPPPSPPPPPPSAPLLSRQERMEADISMLEWIIQARGRRGRARLH